MCLRGLNLTNKNSNGLEKAVIPKNMTLLKPTKFCHRPQNFFYDTQRAMSHSVRRIPDGFWRVSMGTHIRNDVIDIDTLIIHTTGYGT